jgi:Putative transposase
MLAALRASFSRENVGRYLAHPPSILDRIVGDPSAGKVLYTGKAIHPRHRANFRVFDPLAFLAEICAHIPDPHEKTAIYYGWYSNRTRGFRKARGLLPPVTMQVISVIEDEEVIYRIRSHLKHLSPGEGSRAPPESVRAGFASPATPVSRERSYDPIHDWKRQVQRGQFPSVMPISA